MHRHFIIIVFILLIGIVSCKEASKKVKKTDNEETTTLKKEKPKGLQKGCYVYNTNRSTISLQVTKLEDSVSGILLYALAEKDKNTGRFTGTLNNNILLANYTFESEGKKSMRQIAFKVKNDTLIEGYGETTIQGNTRVFEDTSALEFTSSFPLVKRDCIE